jgi:hypothetical protein
MIERTHVIDGAHTRWYDAKRLIHDLDDRQLPGQSEGSRLRMTRRGFWLVSNWSNWQHGNPPDRRVSETFAHKWLSKCYPMYEPSELGLQGPAYAAYLAEQEL